MKVTKTSMVCTPMQWPFKYLSRASLSELSNGMIWAISVDVILLILHVETLDCYHPSHPY